MDLLYTLDGKYESVNLALNCLDPIYCNKKKQQLKINECKIRQLSNYAVFSKSFPVFWFLQVAILISKGYP